MKKSLLSIFFVFFMFSSFAGQKIIEKGIMEITDDKSGKVSYKILWRVPDSKDSFWIKAAPVGSSDAFTGEYPVDVTGSEPLSAIILGDYAATEEGMARAARALGDIYRAENSHKGGGNGSSSGSSSSGGSSSGGQC